MEIQVKMEADFSGYVTKHNVTCTDGRTILPPAFEASNGQRVPLVWQHQHDSPDNVLGHVVLTHRADGVWGEGFFNDTQRGKHVKTLVEHKDIRQLSIYANQLSEHAKKVMHGVIREVSLVYAGANPGAYIQNVTMAHSEEVIDSEAVISFGEQELLHTSTTVPGPRQIPMGNGPMPTPPANAGEGETVADVYNTLNPAQKNLVYALVGKSIQQGDTDNNLKDGPVSRNVFKSATDGTNANQQPAHTISHDDAKAIFQNAQKLGSLKAAVEGYALQHNIDSIETLFPFDQAVTDTPEFISRRMEWVQGVLGNVHRTPFARIRSWTADITMDQARAKGYIKANLKKEEFFSISRRVTTPQTIYKKQSLDRDDIIDITEFDVVVWLQTEMRLMLDEELARAILVGDGRDIDDDDKIDPTHIRPILGDDPLYVSTFQVDLTDGGSSADEIVDAIVGSMRYYRGSGQPVMYTTRPYLTQMLLAKDTLGRRLYPTVQELAAAMGGVSAIIPVEAMEASTGVIGIIVNLTDYTVGMDRGGQVSMFDFFDIDYNKNKYLIETRCAGAMTKYKGAVVVKEFTGVGGILLDPTPPTFVTSTGVGTIPTTSHVTYVTVATDGTESSALTAGAQTAISAGATVHYRAKAASTYSFADDEHEDWTFTRDDA
jgi:HK97 family phage prohead protease